MDDRTRELERRWVQGADPTAFAALVTAAARSGRPRSDAAMDLLHRGPITDRYLALMALSRAGLMFPDLPVVERLSWPERVMACIAASMYSRNEYDMEKRLACVGLSARPWTMDIVRPKRGDYWHPIPGNQDEFIGAAGRAKAERMAADVEAEWIEIATTRHQHNDGGYAVASFFVTPNGYSIKHMHVSADVVVKLAYNIVERQHFTQPDPIDTRACAMVAAGVYQTEVWIRHQEDQFGSWTNRLCGQFATAIYPLRDTHFKPVVAGWDVETVRWTSKRDSPRIMAMALSVSLMDRDEEAPYRGVNASTTLGVARRQRTHRQTRDTPDKFWPGELKPWTPETKTNEKRLRHWALTEAPDRLSMTSREAILWANLSPLMDTLLEAWCSGGEADSQDIERLFRDTDL